MPHTSFSMLPNTRDACMPLEGEPENLPHPEALESDAEEGSTGRKPTTFNGTAYRIFKLLEWLHQSPLSVDALNQKFCQDPHIGKAVSSDSVWLYINTLKALGCRIQRPSPKNNFQYLLLSHPFGLTLSEHQQETMILAKAYAQKSFSHQEMRILDGLLKKIIQHSDTTAPQERINALFNQSRSFDYEASHTHIEQLEQSILEQRLLQVDYQSPLKGLERFFFLPELLYYEQGVVYLRGDRADFKGPSSLRIDRITALEVVQQETTRTHLQERRTQKTEVRIRFFLENLGQWDGLGLTQQHGVYAEMHYWSQSAKRPYVEVCLQVRDYFYLKQKLLHNGEPFQIVAPDDFKQDMQATLKAMLEHYHPAKESRHVDG